jgi:hypothetical protein
MPMISMPPIVHAFTSRKSGAPPQPGFPFADGRTLPVGRRVGRLAPKRWRSVNCADAASTGRPERPLLTSRPTRVGPLVTSGAPTTGRLGMLVKICRNDKGNPPGKLADAELHFSEGALDGLKLIGFAIWERRNGTGRNVTFPARQYSVNGERRSFSLLRPMAEGDAQNRLRDLILEAYETHEEQAAMAE